MSYAAPVAVPYEARLDADPRWALSEASQFFEGSGAVQQTLRKITRRLDDLKIPYAIVGGLALFSHGFRRFTEDVDILVTPESLREIHKNLEGPGYLPLSAGGRNLRDTETGVRIEFLVTGQYPGDGKPKPVAFPDPAAAAVEINGIKYVQLSILIALKLASGMTHTGRLKDLADVQELMKVLHLPRDLAGQLPEFVRPKYLEIWDLWRQGAEENP
jgi:hypothetical protein